MRTLDALDVDGRRVLVRADFNVPLHDGQISDDARIRAALPTIEELRRRGARIVLASHLGRPKGPDPALSLAPVAARLSELVGAPVPLAPEVVGERARTLTEALRPGDLMMLENVRFEPGETRNDPELARRFATLADAYVDDAFGAAHRAHASTEGVAHLLPSAAGRLLEREVRTLRTILEDPRRPLVAVIGGAKVTDKIGGHRALPGDRRHDPHRRGDVLPVPVGARPRGRCIAVRAGGDRARARGARRGRERRTGAPAAAERSRHRHAACPPMPRTRALDGVDVPEGWMGLDIGPASAARYGHEIAQAGTVFWNGPMGAFELEPFAAGTRAVAEAVADSPATTVVGGGDSAAALHQFGLAERVDHLSTGGGATLELIEGRPLPGVAVLEDAPRGRRRRGRRGARVTRTPLIAGNWKMYKTDRRGGGVHPGAAAAPVGGRGRRRRDLRAVHGARRDGRQRTRLARGGVRAEHAPGAGGTVHRGDLGADAVRARRARRRARPLRAAPAVR